MSPLLAVENLTTRFDTFERSVTAVDQLSFTLNQGDTLGIVGSTSSGKSVLLKSIMSLVPYPGRTVGGKVLLAGRDLLQASPAELQAIRGKDISIILPNPRTVLNPLQPVGAQIANLMRMHQPVTRAAAEAFTLEMLRKVNIPDAERRMDAFPHELSGGMCQRIVIAMSLINSPKVLLADEISSGLDVTIQRQIFDLLAVLVRDFGSSTIIVTRDFGLVANYCSRVAVMAGGIIVEMDNVQTFFDRARHPVSLHLLRCSFAAKGAEALKPDGGRAAAPEALRAAAGDLVEVEPGHLVRVDAQEVAA